MIHSFPAPVLGLALLLGGTGLRAQLAPLPQTGDVHRLLQELHPVLELVRIGDPSTRERLAIDPDSPGIELSTRAIPGGYEHVLTGTLATSSFGSWTFRAEVSALRTPAAGWDLDLALSVAPDGARVESMGFGLVLADLPGIQGLLVPAFSGVAFQEPALSLRDGKTTDTGFAASMQTCCAWSNDGSGLRLQFLDPSGIEPERLRFARADIDGSRGVRIEAETYLPADVGLSPKLRMPLRVEPYQWDPQLHEPWFPAAKLYRSWLLANSTSPGGLLEAGPVASRTDTPAWLRELDLLVSEHFGWFPIDSEVPEPLLALKRHKEGLGAENVLLSLWNWGDRQTPYGLFGTWLPSRSVARQIRNLYADGVRVAGYTHPGFFDLRNPAFWDFQLYPGIVQHEDGMPVIQWGGGGEPFVLMDVGDPFLVEWYRLLAGFHAQTHRLSGFYTDLPVAAGMPDFVRPTGMPTGTSHVGYGGYAAVHRAAQAGAAKGVDGFATFHEACFEWLVRSANLGQGATQLFGRVVPGDDRSEFVPFFQTVYSGYTTFWPADPGLGTQTLEFVPNAYGDFAEFHISRLLAEGVTLGGIPNTSELFLREGKLFYEKQATIPVIGRWLEHHAEVLRTAVRLRRENRAWLAYGELLASPVLEGDRRSMVLNVHYLESGVVAEPHDKLLVPTTAWRAPDLTIRFFAFNGSGVEGEVVLDLERVGLGEIDKLVEVGGARVHSPRQREGRKVFVLRVAAKEALVLEPR